MSTHAFLSVVHPLTASHPSQGTYWDATVALGHPGLLWAAYGGYKELVPLGVGRHTIVTDLSAIVGAPAVLTFDITVCR